MSRLLGLVGARKTATDPVALKLQQLRGYTPVRLGAGLRTVLAGLSESDWEEEVAAEFAPLGDACVNSVLQSLKASGIERFQDPSFWTAFALSRIDDLLARAGTKVLVPDVRREAECEAIHSRGGLILHVHTGDRWVPEGFDRRWADQILVNDRDETDLHWSLMGRF